ncbi:MAG: ATP-binding cassette domain-containing protein [Halothiobacillaceae bacterium]
MVNVFPAVMTLHDLQVGIERPLNAPLNIRIHPGSLTVVVGDNGVGKTTLLRTLAGALAAVSGTIERPAELVVHHLPQHAGARLAGPFSVADLLRLSGLEGLQDPWIPQVASQRVDRLSGGQRQRLVVACALHSSCDLLLLDEPDQYLDRDSRRQLFERLGKTARDKAVVVVSHQVDLPPAADILRMVPAETDGTTGR